MINNRFKIIRRSGEGRSQVYQCTDVQSDYTYALKVAPLSFSEEELNKFTEEFYTLKKLNHPGIIKAYDTGIVFESINAEIPAGSRYILLEYFEGVELSEKKDLHETDLRDIIIQTASVLQYLHQSSYIYYDLKPENILISDAGGDPVIKLIDFGFARTADIKNEARGTAEYIAPELLRNEPHDHRVDYYSLGILIYRLIYGCFPFDNSSEIKVFKAQLENSFNYPENHFSGEINSLMKKLLHKDPEQRYLYAMQIFADLSYMPAPAIVTAWLPAKKFSGRRDIINILNSYVRNYNTGEIFIIKGAEGSGKSALLQHFTEMNAGTILVNSARTKYGLDFIKDLLEKVLYNENVFNCIAHPLREKVKNLINNPPHNIINELKGFFSIAIRHCRMTFAVDDFNFLDELSLELFREIFPLFQVYNVKLILTENSDYPGVTDFIHNKHELSLSPFTEAQLTEYIENTFYPYYPKEELRKTILTYADLLPGNIESFLMDLVISGIIKYQTDEISFLLNEKTLGILKESHDYFYKIRIERLTDEESAAAQILSIFQNIPDSKILTAVLQKSGRDFERIIGNLQNKNILHISGNLKIISFTSVGMKNYIAALISDKKRLHSNIACLLEVHSPKDIKEIAYQYESAGEYRKSLDYFKQMYDEASRIDAYNYQKNLLEHIIKFPLSDEEKSRLQFELCGVLHKSGANVAALEMCNELLLFTSDAGLLNELLILRGVCLIGSGNPESGIKQIEHLVDVLEDDRRRQKLQTEIASAYLDLNKFDEAEKICKDIIVHNTADKASIAQCSNLLGIISIHRDNDFDTAYDYFHSAEDIYSAAELRFGTAQMQLNLANIKIVKEDLKEAERLLRNSLDLNSTIGNLKHEATILLNMGVLYFDRLEYVKAIEYYKKALSVFSHTGDMRGQGLVNTNLGEIYFLSCNYYNALYHVLEAGRIFHELHDTNEELESLFLAGKIYLELDSKPDVERIIASIDMLILNQGAKHEYNLRFLKLMSRKRTLNFYHEIKSIINYYFNQGDKRNYFTASMTAIKFLYENQLYEEAFEEINRNELAATAELNAFFSAEWNLYSGMIMSRTGGMDVHSSEYYLKAYKIVEDLNISEVTCKIMITLAGFYSSRGNTLRAEEYAYYCRNLIDHISENIGNEILIRSYRSKPEVAHSLELCRKILNGNG
jgi:serine/threonine protein kinase/tetratricopeptide (TPR) repeat protein